jgi:hypothetical protein
MLLCCAKACQKGGRLFTERRSFAQALVPQVSLLSWIALQVMELRCLLRAAQDQRPVTRRHHERHVAGDAAGTRIDGRRDLALSEVERPRADHKGAMVVPVAKEDVLERLSLHGRWRIDLGQLALTAMPLGLTLLYSYVTDMSPPPLPSLCAPVRPARP